MQKWIALIFPIFLLASAIQAERIQMKNGDLFSGKIIRLNVEYALVNSYLGDFRIPRKYISIIENTSGLPVKVILPGGEILKLSFQHADAENLHFLQDSKKISLKWENIQDCIFLDK